MVKSFYADRGLNAETYDARTLGFPGEIEFWVTRALASGGPVLELACGTGRVSWPIARAGIEIVGLDLAPAMLERAESKRDTERPDVGARVKFVLGNMADFAFPERFALAVIPFRAFQMLLGIDEQRRSLCCIHAHLRPGGRLIVDIFDPRLDLLAEERFVPQRQIPDYRNPLTGHTVSIDVLERVNDHVEQRLAERWRFREIADDGRVMRDEEERLELRWIYRYEMHHLLELSGFVVEEERSDFAGAPPTYGREQIIIASKNG